MIGIYALWFEKSDQVYIGQSIDIQKRYRKHKHLLKYNKHPNHKITKEYNLFGVPELIILEECLIEHLNDLEIEYIKEYDSIKNGLNIIEGGDSGNGTNSATSKYSRYKILRIFVRLAKTNDPQLFISKVESVPKSLVYAIKNGNNHLWLKESYPMLYEKMRNRDISFNMNNKNYTLTKEQCINIFNLLCTTTLSCAEIGRITKVPDYTVKSICNGKTHSWLNEEFPEQYKFMLKREKSKGGKVKTALVVSPDKEIVEIVNLTKFCKDNFPKNVEAYRKYLGEVINGKRDSYNGWSKA